MKLSDILTTVGSGLVSALVPGGPLLIAAVNEMLPDDKKLPANATGQQAASVINTLPADTRAQVLGKEFDVTIEAHSTLRTMLETEQKSQQTTRPKIALGAFHVVSFVIIMVVSAWFIAVLQEDTETLSIIVDGWPFVLAAIGPFVGWLNHYFGILKTEQKNRLDAATGNLNANGLTGVIKSFIVK